MSLYDKIIITRPEPQHGHLKGLTAYITHINRSQDDYAGFDPASNEPMFDLADENGQPIFNVLYLHEVTAVRA